MKFRSTACCLFLLPVRCHAWQPFPAALAPNRALLAPSQIGYIALRLASTSRKGDYDVDVSALFQGRSAKQVWRPDKQDVERISWGKPARKKGTGSRGIPHRLNQEERQLWDRARQKGFLEVAGSGWRSQRRDAPLCNSYRSWCDACAQASIVVHKSNTGVEDAVVVDISPLRLEEASEFQSVAKTCLEQQPGGFIQSQVGSDAYCDEQMEEDEEEENASLLDAWETRPIYQLPRYCIVWGHLQRAEAKDLGKRLVKTCQINLQPREQNSKKPFGVKHGKGRRHGGYGIG